MNRDRRIKAIFIANNITDLNDVEIIGFEDNETLKIIKSGKELLLNINGIEEIDDDIFDDDVDDDDIFDDDVDDDSIDKSKNIDKELKDYHIDLDDDIDLNDEVNNIEVPSQKEKLEKVIESEKNNTTVKTKKDSKKTKKTLKSKSKKKKTNIKKDKPDDDIINLV